MSSAGWELQKAALADDSALVALLAGRVYDDVPRGAEFPYITFGPATLRDWSTGTETASEHLITPCVVPPGWRTPGGDPRGGAGGATTRKAAFPLGTGLVNWCC